MHEFSIHELAQHMEEGSQTSVSITTDYLATIETHNPKLGAVVETNPQALALAEILDQERRAGKVRGPLHGIPILIKDNIDTGDSMETTAGSLALLGSRPNQDAIIVQNLRRAGALILGKTNLSEWANFRGKKSISGWSSRGGQTRNPYNLNHSPGGSSSGSGSAVAANFCAGAVGTETDGSIISPSNNCGICGLKPSQGLLSQAGIIPISHSQDTAGPMGRTIMDLVYLLQGLSGKPYLQSLGPKALRGARIGVARTIAGTDQGVLDLFEENLRILRSLGATLVDPIDLPRAESYGDLEFEVLIHEFKDDLNGYLGRRGHPLIPNLEAVIAFNTARASVVMPWFGQEYLQESQGHTKADQKSYEDALGKLRQIAGTQGLESAFAQHRVHALVVPSGGPAWMIDHKNGDHINSDVESTSLAAVTGYPHVTVPMGSISGLPVGLSFIGRPMDDGPLLSLAHHFEMASKARRPPVL